MTNEAYKAWLDAMPIDDVHESIERLEHKLSNLRTAERLYTDRQPGGETAAANPGADAMSETRSESYSPEGPDEPT
jgi:hypothetical protein